MFTRVVQLTGAKDIDGGLAFVREEVVPVLHQQNGFKGVTASADRAGGEFGVMTLWDTAAHRDANESAMLKLREEAKKIIGGTLEVAVYEEVVFEAVGIPSPGSQLLIRRLGMDPASIDGNLEFFKREVLPEIKAQPGFLAIRNMINRTTGEGVVGTVWTDRKSLDAAAETAATRQARGESRGLTFGPQSKREVLFVEMT